MHKVTFSIHTSRQRHRYCIKRQAHLFLLHLSTTYVSVSALILLLPWKLNWDCRRSAAIRRIGRGCGWMSEAEEVNWDTENIAVGMYYLASMKQPTSASLCKPFLLSWVSVGYIYAISYRIIQTHSLHNVGQLTLASLNVIVILTPSREQDWSRFRWLNNVILLLDHVTVSTIFSLCCSY